MYTVLKTGVVNLHVHKFFYWRIRYSQLSKSAGFLSVNSTNYDQKYVGQKWICLENFQTFFLVIIPQIIPYNDYNNYLYNIYIVLGIIHNLEMILSI
jgi:hypothetical protein